jgi:vancomycin resistance protein VanJ
MRIGKSSPVRLQNDMPPSPSQPPLSEVGALPTPTDAPKKSPLRRFRIVGWLSWIYLITVVALWLLLHFAGDRWWIATLILFGPLWVFALPLIILLPLAIFLRRRSLPVLLLGGLIVLFPIMDFCIPWRAAISTKQTGGSPLRVLTCNTHYHLLNPKSLADLINATHPDVVALQEWTSLNEKPVFGDGAWNMIKDGEFCLASKLHLRKVAQVSPETGWLSAICFEIQTLTGGPIYLFNVHLASPHPAFRSALGREPRGSDEVHRNSQRRLEGAQAVQRYAATLKGPVLLAGDFNLPINSSVYRDHLSRYTDAFATAGFGFGWTYHARWTDTRIDHILADDNLRCIKCWVGPDVGSPHRPVIADLQP